MSENYSGLVKRLHKQAAWLKTLGYKGDIEAEAAAAILALTQQRDEARIERSDRALRPSRSDRSRPLDGVQLLQHLRRTLLHRRPDTSEHAASIDPPQLEV